MSGANTQAPPKATRLPPAGVQRAMVHHVRPKGTVAAPLDDLNTADTFLTNPFIDGGVKGFTEVSFPDALKTAQVKIVSTQLVNKKRKTFIASVFQDTVGSEPCKQLLIVMRGDRKQSGDKFFSMDERMRAALASSLFTTKPSSPASYHPWFSSVVHSLTSKYNVCAELCEPVEVISDLFKAGNVTLVVVEPSAQADEAVLHKLAIDKALDSITQKDSSAHISKWMSENNKFVSTSNSFFKVMCNISDGINKPAAKPAAAAKPATQPATQPTPKAAPKSRASSPAPAPPSDGIDSSAAVKRTRDSDDEDMSPVKKTKLTEPAPRQPKGIADSDDSGDDIAKPVAAPVAAKTKAPAKTVPADKKGVSESDDSDDESDKKKQRDKKYKRGGQCKFILDSVTVDRKAGKEEQEEEEGEYSDVESSESEESGSEKEQKKKKRKRVCDSDSGEESSLSGSEDSDDEDDSDDDDDDNDCSEEEDATSSEDEETPKKRKKGGRLVKTKDLSSGDGLRQTTLALAKTNASSSPAGSPTPAKEGTDDAVKEPREARKPDRGPPALSNRIAVAREVTNAVDAVDACVGVPPGITAKITQITKTIREGFGPGLYTARDFAMKDSYHLYSSLVKLIVMQTAIINANLSPDQRDDDAKVTRRLAISTTSGLMEICPAIGELRNNASEALKKLTELEKIFKEVATDMEASSSEIAE